MSAPALADLLDTFYALVREVAGVPDGGDVVPERDLAVKDGPLSSDLDQANAIGVGVDAGTEEGEPAGVSSARVSLRRQDSFTITCVTQSLNGDDDLPAARREANALLAIVEAAVARLEETEAVWSAEVVGHAYRPLRTDNGALAVIESSVRVEAIRMEQRR